jgi:hypothetical protein
MADIPETQEILDILDKLNKPAWYLDVFDHTL